MVLNDKYGYMPPERKGELSCTLVVFSVWCDVGVFVLLVVLVSRQQAQGGRFGRARCGML